LNGDDSNLYRYVYNNSLNLFDPLGLRALRPDERQRIVDTARSWAEDKVPYISGGRSRKGADCSGSVYGIYKEAKLPFEYSPSSTFAQNPSFLPVDSPQLGDVGLYDGHVVIYDPNAGLTRTGLNADVWSATHPHGETFGPGVSTWYGNDVHWYTYDVQG
jgi:hypothetical protein